MPVYMIIDIKVTDADLYSEYVEKVPATVKKYSGRYLVRGGNVEVLAGDWQPERIVLLEFPSTEHLKQWLMSPEYTALAPIREKSTNAKAIVVEGVGKPLH